MAGSMPSHPNIVAPKLFRLMSAIEPAGWVEDKNAESIAGARINGLKDINKPAVMLTTMSNVSERQYGLANRPNNTARFLRSCRWIIQKTLGFRQAGHPNRPTSYSSWP